MKRGDIWTVAGAAGYAGKPRPAVIVQDDRFDQIDSVVICPLTSDPSELPLFRLVVEPNERNGLRSRSAMMVDKISAVRKKRLGRSTGQLDDEDILRLNQALMVFLGLAESPRARRDR